MWGEKSSSGRMSNDMRTPFQKTVSWLSFHELVVNSLHNMCSMLDLKLFQKPHKQGIFFEVYQQRCPTKRFRSFSGLLFPGSEQPPAALGHGQAPQIATLTPWG